MEHDKWTRTARFCAGALCAALWTWLSVAVCVFLGLSLYSNFDWGILVAAPLGLISLVAILFGAGVFATYFWVAINDCSPDERWSEFVIFIILAPLLYLGWWIIPVLIPAFLLAILPFDYGRDWGEEVWENRRWRHLFDFANDWEREENQR